MVTTIEFQQLVGFVDFDVVAQVDTAERIVQAISARVTETQAAVLLTRRVRAELERLALEYADELWS